MLLSVYLSVSVLLLIQFCCYLCCLPCQLIAVILVILVLCACIGSKGCPLDLVGNLICPDPQWEHSLPSCGLVVHRMQAAAARLFASSNRC